MLSENRYFVTIDRDSVCAGDDTDPHEMSLSLPDSATIADLLAEILRRHFLASISGGKATWLIEVPGLPNPVIGVTAQQWEAPKLLVPPETSLTALFADNEPSLYFRYQEQSDPDAVFSGLPAGGVLKER